MGISSNQLGLEDLYKYIKRLEERITRIEALLNQKVPEIKDDREPSPPAAKTVSEQSEVMEFQIGQFWFARVGIVVLAIGVIFLLTFPYQHLPPVFPSLIGYALVGGLFALSYLWRKSFLFLSRYLLGGGIVLLYFATLRLYFFSVQPAVAHKPFVLFLLLLVVAVSLTIAVRRKSVYLSGIGLTMGYITAIVGGQAYFLFGVTTLISALAVYFKLKYRWNGLLFLGIIFTYFTYFIWFINNPFLGNKLQIVSSPQINILFLLLYAVIFSFANLLRDRDVPEDSVVISSTFLNCLGCYSLYLVQTIISYPSHLFLFHILASVVFLTLSVVFWLYEKSKYSTFYFAILGYVALSIAIVVQFPRPDYFFWLCWQSLLVITTAIWFRSKIIVLANFIIYLLIFIAYLVLAGEVTAISLSFGGVALLSARIMNWQKHRLNLKTEFMRNAYLTTAFVIFPYALYHSVPDAYVSLSWVGIAIFYYLISLILKNKKYRWMALLTLLLTVGYVFIIGIARLEAVYRIISFLVLGVVLLIISLIYSRLKARSKPDNVETE